MQETLQSAGTAVTQAPREVRRSFKLLFLDLTFFMAGFAFLDASTIMPTFLATLNASPLVIGIITAIRPAGGFLPQLWTAHYLRDRTKHKSYLVRGALVSRVAVALFAILVFFAGPSDRRLILWAFVIMYSAFWLSEGWITVSWTDLVAKTIPERLRGRLFGLTQVVGGGLAMLMGLLAVRILSPGGPGFPLNYAVLYAVAAVMFAASLFSLGFVREPEGAAEKHDGGFLRYLGKVGRILAENRMLKRLLAVQLLIGAFGMSLPYYILYLRETAGVGAGMVAVFLIVQQVGGIVWSGVTGYVSDHKGPKWAIVCTVIAGIAAPVLALLLRDSPVWLYGAIFLAVGALTTSAVIGPTNYLLEIAEPEKRRAYIGVLNTANAPSMVFPILGGLVVQIISYQAMFIMTTAALLLALALAVGLHSKSGAESS